MQVLCSTQDDSYLGSHNATSDAAVDAPVAKTMYCLPSCMNVIGTADVYEGMFTAPTCLPVALSTAYSCAGPGGPPLRPVP